MKPGIIIGEHFVGVFVSIEKGGPYFFEVHPYTYVSRYKSRRRVQKIYTEGPMKI